MPQQRKTNTSARRTSPRKKGKKTGGFFLFRWLRSIPMWGFVLGGVGVVALYCFVLFHFFVDPYSFQWKAIYGETTYPAEYTVRGIDVSHYQEKIDWERLRNANMGNDPVSFVIIKATEGVSLMDDYFNENFYQARRNGLIRGAYHFLTPDVSAQMQAEFFLRQAHLEEGDLPPVLDIEDERKWLASGKNKKQIQSMALEWLKVVEKHYGVKPIIYSSYRFRRDILTDKRFDEYPFWMAHYYVSEPAKSVKWHFWQHTDCGKLSGIRGPVDCNVFHGTRAELEQLLIKEIPDER
jgi:lysozyme